MPSLTTVVPHTLGRELALERLRNFVTSAQDRYRDHLSDMEGTWVDNRLDYGFRARGLKIAGTLTVEDEHARVELQLPFAALIFRGQLEQEIHRQLKETLAPVLYELPDRPEVKRVEIRSLFEPPLG